jgi:CheY-like chemotaxis protein
VADTLVPGQPELHPLYPAPDSKAPVDSARAALQADAPDGSPPPTRPSLLPAGDPARDLAGALHEVSNALTVVLGWIERARGVTHDPVEIERALDVAAARAAQARTIVRRAIGAETHADPVVMVRAVVADAITGLDPELRRAGVAASGSLAAGVGSRTIAHASSVLQILTNLLLNAIAASPAGSMVRVSAAAADGPGEVIFAVADEGPGIPPERRRSLFHAGVTTRAGGAGIGLRHAAALARSLGGELSLAETDTGARLELRWPASAPATGEPRAEAGPTQPSAPVSIPRAMPLQGSRILLVEDDDAVVDLLDTALTARGADVVSVRHRRDLAGALATGPFDVALFDISPIQADVQGAVASARDGSDGLRVVLISGSASQMPELPRDWVAAWVRKPFEIGEILQALSPREPGKTGG